MIRDNRTFVAVNIAGVALALFGVVLRVLYPPVHPIGPPWIYVGLPALIGCIFIYNIVARLRGKQPPESAFGLSDRQLWIAKGIILAVLTIAATSFAFYVWTHK
ncbi:MAG TPA: hypothetical protein VGF18_00345 [Candidatus Tumulicola sp.]|jgi:hypothetical protein